MPQPLAKRLLIKSGFTVSVLNAPAGLMARIDGLPEGVELSESSAESADVWIVFVKDSAAIAKFGTAAISQAKDGAVVWFAYPKKSGNIKTDISRDHGWSPVEALGWAPVTQISIDETWSALRFKPVSAIKTMTRKFGPHTKGG